MKKIKLFAIIAGAFSICFFSQPKQTLNASAAEEITSEVTSEVITSQNEPISISLSEDNSSEEDGFNWLRWVSNTLVETWDKVQVWLPVTVGGLGLVLLRILKTILSIYTSKKNKAEMDKNIEQLNSDLKLVNEQKDLIMEFFSRTIDVLNDVGSSIINPQAKEKILNGIKLIQNDLANSLNNINQNISEVKEEESCVEKDKEQNSNKEESAIYTGD